MCQTYNILYRNSFKKRYVLYKREQYLKETDCCSMLITRKRRLIVGNRTCYKMISNEKVESQKENHRDN